MIQRIKPSGLGNYSNVAQALCGTPKCEATTFLEKSVFLSDKAAISFNTASLLALFLRLILKYVAA
jgi:hypothetical protein